MKKQVLTIAAVLAASSFAFASGPSQSATNMSSNASATILDHIDSASNTSMEFSRGIEGASESIQDTLRKEADQDLRKNSVLSNMSGSSLAVGAYTVSAVRVVSKGANDVIEFVLKGAQKGSRLVLKVTRRVAKPVAHGTDRAGRRIFKVGEGIVIGASASGTVIVTESAESLAQALHGNISASSGTMFGSVSKASQAFGAKVVEGFKN